MEVFKYGRGKTSFQKALESELTLSVRTKHGFVRGFLNKLGIHEILSLPENCLVVLCWSTDSTLESPLTANH